MRASCEILRTQTAAVLQKLVRFSARTFSLEFEFTTPFFFEQAALLEVSSIDHLSPCRYILPYSSNEKQRCGLSKCVKIDANMQNAPLCAIVDVLMCRRRWTPGETRKLKI